MQAHYVVSGIEGDPTAQLDYDVTTAGDHRARVLIHTSYDDYEELFVWDGHQMYKYSSDAQNPYSLFEAPQEHPDEFGIVSGWTVHPSDDDFKASCPATGRLPGTTTIAGRSAIGYRCHHVKGQPNPFLAGTVWIDQVTGLLLKSGPLRADRVTPNPNVDDTTFSTEPPDDVQVIIYAAKRPPAGTKRSLPDFTATRLDGGSIGLQDLAGHPFVLAFYLTGLVSYPQGHQCPRCIPSLLALQRYTRDGTNPRVLVLQLGDPSDQSVPAGLHLTIARDDTLQPALALSNQVGFAFIGSDGTIQQLIDRPATDKELREAVAGLR
jgi:hypothetical protein